MTDAELIARLRKIRPAGCTNHGCVFGHPGGMGTNSVCRCLEAPKAMCAVYLRDLVRHANRLLDLAEKAQP